MDKRKMLKSAWISAAFRAAKKKEQLQLSLPEPIGDAENEQ